MASRLRPKRRSALGEDASQGERRARGDVAEANWPGEETGRTRAKTASRTRPWTRPQHSARRRDRFSRAMAAAPWWPSGEAGAGCLATDEQPRPRDSHTALILRSAAQRRRNPTTDDE